MRIFSIFKVFSSLISPIPVWIDELGWGSIQLSSWKRKKNPWNFSASRVRITSYFCMCVWLMAVLCFGLAKVNTCLDTLLNITQQKVYGETCWKCGGFDSAEVDVTDCLESDVSVSSAFHCQLKQTQNLSGVNSSCLPPDIISNSFGICFRFRERETFDELLVRTLFSNLWITLRWGVPPVMKGR